MTDNTTSGNIERGNTFTMEPRDLPADHPDANIANDRANGLHVREGVHGFQNGDASPPADAEYIAAQSPEIIVQQVELRVAKLERQLAETVGFDPVSGEPVPLLKGRARENADRELAQLKLSTLPFARIQAAEVARAKAALPTQADKLQAEADAAAAKHKRALERADELEAEEEAQRILTARRRQTMG
ncbi:MAG TPA: hypothetical protein VJ823_01705 [Rhodanobacteraceae bacterium]|nr:hypothetical protein [Rhodanobacteraceae bacterium]